MATASSTAGSSTGGTAIGSVFLGQDVKMLKKKQVEDLLRQLEQVTVEEVLGQVKLEVGKGYHLAHFPERQVFWEACIRSSALRDIVSALRTEYVRLVRTSSKGREKFGHMQIRWMEVVHDVLHKSSPVPDDASDVLKKWAVLLKAPGSPSEATKSAIVTSLARAVFNYCQQRIVAVKEGVTLLLEEEQDTDPASEAGLGADEASLFRLGGFALYSTQKAYGKLTGDRGRQAYLVLQKMELPAEGKVDLPANIQHLDKGSMTFMKKEFLGFLAQVFADSYCVWLCVSLIPRLSDAAMYVLASLSGIG